MISGLKLVLLGLGLLPSFALSETLVVSADREYRELSRASGQVTVLGREEIERSRVSTIDELLNTLKGTQVVTQGPPGSQGSLFLRGHEARHTLVMIDGVIVNDPSNPSNQYDFGHLGVHDIERLEILKGPQALLYGPGALAGVISITTSRPTEKPLQRAQVQLGSYWDRQLTVSSRTENFSLSSHYQKTKGFSAVNPQDGSAPTPDGRELITLRFAGSTHHQTIGEISYQASVHQDITEIDGFSELGKVEDRPDDETKQFELAFNLQQKKTWVRDRWQQSLQLARFSHRRRTTQNDVQTTFDSQRYQITFDNDLFITPRFSAKLGLDQRFEQAKTNERQRQKIVAPYVQLRFDEELYFFSLGGRASKEDYEKTFFSEQIAMGFFLPLGALKITHGQGHQAPSLFQRFDPSFGNPNLVRERSNAQEISFTSVPLFLNIVFEGSFYQSRIRDRFDFDPLTFQTINKGEALIYGHDLGLRLTEESFTSSLSYQRVLSRDRFSGARLTRRASHLVQWNYFQRLNPLYSLNFDLQYIGARPETSAQRLSSYFLFNTAVTRTLSYGELWLRLGNIFDRDYEVVPGFQAPGRTFIIGFAQNF